MKGHRKCGNQNVWISWQKPEFNQINHESIAKLNLIMIINKYTFRAQPLNIILFVLNNLPMNGIEAIFVNLQSEYDLKFIQSYYFKLGTWKKLWKQKFY